MRFLHVIAMWLLLVAVQGVSGQEANNSELFLALAKMDSLIFEESFNNCNHTVLVDLISDDLEFYHDKGGITQGKTEFIESVRKNVCGATNKARRELVPGSLQVFPLYEKGELYGAIQMGNHLFYQKPPNENEFLAGSARFTHLWLKDGNSWMLKRVLSYDHGNGNQFAKEVVVAPDTLKRYSGTYEAPETGKVHVEFNGDHLVLTTKKGAILLQPKNDTLFFFEDANLSFEFKSNEDNQVEKLIVRENGIIAEEAVKIN